MAAQTSDVFNVARGKVRYYLELPGADDSLVVVLLKSAGLPADSVLIDYPDLGSLLAAAPDEADFTSYARKTFTTAAFATDSANDWVTATLGALSWAAAGGTTNNQLGKLLVCYKPTSTSADTTIIPLLYFQYVTTTDGTTRNVNPNAAGSWSSRSVA